MGKVRMRARITETIVNQVGRISATLVYILSIIISFLCFAAIVPCNAEENTYKVNLGHGVLLGAVKGIYDGETNIHVPEIQFLISLKNDFDMEIGSRFFSPKNGFIMYELSDAGPEIFALNISLRKHIESEYVTPYYGAGIGGYYIETLQSSSDILVGTKKKYQFTIGGMTKIGFEFLKVKYFNLYSEIKYDYFKVSEMHDGRTHSENGGGASVSLGIKLNDEVFKKLIYFFSGKWPW
jgi:hypothetical protein